MLYFHLNTAKQIDNVTDDGKSICNLSDVGTQWARQANGEWQSGWFNRNDIVSMQHAVELAQTTGGKYMAIDSGPNVSPRFDIIETPKVGDDCSKAFNGDYYPVGKIVKVSGDDLRVITVDGPRGVLRFYRKGQSGRWVQTGGTWGLVAGVHNDWNREF